MPAIIWDDDIVPFEVEGETFNLKRKMSHGDHRVLELEFVRLGALIQKGEVPTEAGVPTLLTLNIKGWSLRDRDGAPLLVTPENINRLDPDVSDKLLEEIGRRNPPSKGQSLTKKSGLPKKPSKREKQ